MSNKPGLALVVDVNGLEGSFTVTAPLVPPLALTPAYVAGATVIIASIIGAIVLRWRRVKPSS